jgi:hypothetical protein
MQGNPPLVEYIKETKNKQGLFWIENYKISDSKLNFINLIFFKKLSVWKIRSDK